MSCSLPDPLVGCRIRILMVADGLIHFGPTRDGFSLQELITKALPLSMMRWERFEITTARRFGDEDCCTKNKNFRFDVDPFGIEHYDQVWLFGQLGELNPDELLKDGELAVLADFMNSGGGVFATGDHADLGFALCGQIPRVRSMRKWSYYNQLAGSSMKAPGRNDETRIDTLREGFDLGFQMDDQCDTVPQEIRPKFYLNLGGKGSHPHPLLADRGFAITVLPDHMHEGECVVPTNLGETVKLNGRKPFEEYPKLAKSDARLAPELVAISTSAGGYLKTDAGKDVPPVEPRSFNVIVAYDGHQVKSISDHPCGRVVVDASFHHFIDLNLNGTGSNSLDRKGFYDDNGKPTKDYDAFRKYYRNIVTYLCPPHQQLQYFQALLLDLRFNSFLVEELLPVPNPGMRELIYTGLVTRKAISERLSSAAAIQCCLALLSVLPREIRLGFEKIINPWLASELREDGSNPLVDSDFFVHAILGFAMLGITRDLPSSRYQAEQVLAKSEVPGHALSAILTNRIELGLDELTQILEESRAALGALSSKLSRLKED